jgi:hypothetical protein
MTKAFFSFYFDDDVFRAGQVRNMGQVDSDEPIKDQDWEQIKKGKDAAVQKWIADQMKKCDVAIVLVGQNTASRPWVDYEIRYAWNNHMPIFGIRIHGLSDVRNGISNPGNNPFASVGLTTGKKLSDFVPLHSPSGSTSKEVYADIKAKIQGWIKAAPSLSAR